MSDIVEHSLQNKTETINITTVNVDKMDFRNLLIASTRSEWILSDQTVTQLRMKWEIASRTLQTAKMLNKMSRKIRNRMANGSKNTCYIQSLNKCKSNE